MSDYVEVMNQNSHQVDSRRYVEQSSPFLDRVPLSWVAYMRLVKVLFGGFLLTGLFSVIGVWLLKDWLVFIGLLCAVLWIGYAVAKTRATYLFTDPAGVWVSSGVFPWQKGFYGVPWRQIGGAGYHNGFFSWLSKSYRIDVTHAFKDNAGFTLKDLKYGDLVAAHINQTVVGIQ